MHKALAIRSQVKQHVRLGVTALLVGTLLASFTVAEGSVERAFASDRRGMCFYDRGRDQFGVWENGFGFDAVTLRVGLPWFGNPSVHKSMYEQQLFAANVPWVDRSFALPAMARQPTIKCAGMPQSAEEPYVTFYGMMYYGWPLRCLSGAWEHREPSGEILFRNSYPIGSSVSAASLRKLLVLPGRPLWLGLLLNITIWSGVSAVCVFGHRYALRGFRRHRGLCADCGYSLRETTGRRCSECGGTIDRALSR